MKMLLSVLIPLCGLWFVAGGCVGANSAPPPPPPAVATHLSVSSPTTETGGTQFNIKVTALDASNKLASYSATLHFISADPQAVLPANSPLTVGIGAFSVALKTASVVTIRHDLWGFADHLSNIATPEVS